MNAVLTRPTPSAPAAPGAQPVAVAPARPAPPRALADWERLAALPAQLPDCPRASFAQQARQALARLDGALKAQGACTGDLVSLRVYVADMEDWAAFESLYRTWIGRHSLQRTIVRTGALLHGFALELEGVAAVGA